MTAIQFQKARGVANNNPGNIDRGRTPWNNEIRDPKDPRLNAQQIWELTKGRFCVFPEEHWGLRALALNIQAHGRRGSDTVRKIVRGWAPPVENDTNAYIDAVCKTTGLGPDERLDLGNWATMRKLVRAIVIHENGGDPYPADDYEDGLRLAGIVKPVTVTTSTTAKATAVAAGGTVVEGVVATIHNELNEMADALDKFANIAVVNYLLLALKILIPLIVLISIGVILRQRMRREARDIRIEGSVPLEQADPVPSGSAVAPEASYKTFT